MLSPTVSLLIYNVYNVITFIIVTYDVASYCIAAHPISPTHSFGDNNNKINNANMPELSDSIGAHICSSDVLAIDRKGNISIIDLNANERIINVYTNDNINSKCYNNNSFTYDPRSKDEINNITKLTYTANRIANLYKENEIIVSGMTSYLKLILYAYDLNNISDGNYLFKQNYTYKLCKSMISYDMISGILYLTFQCCADIIALNNKININASSMSHPTPDVPVELLHQELLYSSETLYYASLGLLYLTSFGLSYYPSSYLQFYALVGSLYYVLFPNGNLNEKLNAKVNGTIGVELDFLRYSEIRPEIYLNVSRCI